MNTRRKSGVLCLLLLLVLAGCQDDNATQPLDDPGTIIGQVTPGGSDFEIVIDKAGTSDRPIMGPFTLLGRDLRYDESLQALLVDLIIINSGEVTHPEPVGLTFTQLMPDSVRVLNPDNDLHGPGASILFGFANDDAMWTPGEESFPRTVQFAVPPGMAVGFVARVDIGGGAFGGVISGCAWNDMNGNGVQEINEPGLPGILVWLSGEVIRYWNCGKCIPEAITDENGMYHFENLPAGAYQVNVQFLFPDAFLMPTTPTVIHVLLPEIPGGVAHFDQANFGFQMVDMPTVRVPIEMDSTVRSDLEARRNDNYGCDPFIAVGGTRGGNGDEFGDPDGIRGLLYFDLPPFIPNDDGIDVTQVESAVLEMHVARFRDGTGQSYQLDLHRIIDSGDRTPWVEGNGSEWIDGMHADLADTAFGCTWVDAAFGVAWVGAGDGGDDNNQTQPDFDEDVIATAYLHQNALPFANHVHWDVTDLVNGWLSGEIPNYGLVLRDVTSDGEQFKSLWFHSSETMVEVLGIQPELILRYAPPEIDD